MQSNQASNKTFFVNKQDVTIPPNKEQLYLLVAVLRFKLLVPYQGVESAYMQNIADSNNLTHSIANLIGLNLA